MTSSTADRSADVGARTNNTTGKSGDQYCLSPLRTCRSSVNVNCETGVPGCVTIARSPAPCAEMIPAISALQHSSGRRMADWKRFMNVYTSDPLRGRFSSKHVAKLLPTSPPPLTQRFKPLKRGFLGVLQILCG